jgi:hypothetical protein
LAIVVGNHSSSLPFFFDFLDFLGGMMACPDGRAPS